MSNVRSATLPSFPLLPILGLILVTLKLVAGSIQVAPHAAEGLKQGLNRRQLR